MMGTPVAELASTIYGLKAIRYFNKAILDRKDEREVAMKKIFKNVAIIPSLSFALWAQNPTPATPSPQASQPSAAMSPADQGAVRISAGSVIPVALTKSVDAKKAKAGDEVLARVTMDMKTSTGEVIVPKDTKVIGHITGAQAHSKDQKESQLSIAFNQAVLKDQPVNIPMSIQAVVGQEQNNNNDGGPAANGGAGPSQDPPGTSGGAPMEGRAPSSPMSGQSQSPPSGQPDSPDAKKTSGHPPINGQTQGVVGISNLSLSSTSDAQQGSTLTSEKNNVKLESGTMLLLRVNQ
jgi:hypothetical protein